MSDPTNNCVDRADDLVTALIAAMQVFGAAPAVSAIATGDENWEDCCSGKAYVKVVNIFPYRTFPLPTLEWEPCGPNLAATYECVVLRCAPTPDNRGFRAADVPLTVKEANAIATVSDGYAVMLQMQDTINQWQMAGVQAVFQQWQPLGPEANCIGGSVTVIVDLCDPIVR